MVSAFNPADPGAAEEALHVLRERPQPGLPGLRLVAQDEAGVGADGLRADQRGHVDDPLPAPARRIVEEGILIGEAQLPEGA